MVHYKTVLSALTPSSITTGKYVPAPIRRLADFLRREAWDSKGQFYFLAVICSNQTYLSDCSENPFLVRKSTAWFKNNNNKQVFYFRLNKFLKELEV